MFVGDRTASTLLAGAVAVLVSLGDIQLKGIFDLRIWIRIFSGDASIV